MRTDSTQRNLFLFRKQISISGGVDRSQSVFYLVPQEYTVKQARLQRILHIIGSNILMCFRFFLQSFPPPSSRMIGGEEAAYGDFPHQVSLWGTVFLVPQFVCSGSLISDRWVITAAQCCQGFLKVDALQT